MDTPGHSFISLAGDVPIAEYVVVPRYQLCVVGFYTVVITMVTEHNGSASSSSPQSLLFSFSLDWDSTLK